MDLNQVTELATKRAHTVQSTFSQNCYLTIVSQQFKKSEIYRQ
jgi:hypothetical protein